MRRSCFVAVFQIAASLLIVMLGSGTARANAISTFDTDDEGWTIVSFYDLSVDDYSVVGSYTPDWVASGGNPGGYIAVSVDPDVGQFTFAAPGVFLGNQVGMSNLSYDLLHATGDVNFQTTDVMLVGGGTRLLWQSNPSLDPGAIWIHVDVALSPSANWLVGSTTGGEASADDFQTVLGDLTGIFVRGEYTSGDESAGLDNFQLVPEPSSLVLFGLGDVGLLALRRRQLRRAVLK